MKDGKIYEGKILAETKNDVVIKTNTWDRKIKLLSMEDVLTVVHDPPAPEKPFDPQRYAALDTFLTGNLFVKNEVSNPAAGVRLGGGLRLHPLIEIGGGFEWKPALSGDLALSDGIHTREYERFYSFGGGFTAKIFPLYKILREKLEPFLLVGYEWTELVPKDSGDELDGQGMEGGFGAQWPLTKTLYMETRFLYRHTPLDTVDFLGLRGSLDPSIRGDSYSIALGLSLHL
jgi:hypothetical protein